jgi:hypothetical protein
VGTAGGTAGNNQVSGISLLFCDTGSDYNFGLVLPAQLGGSVYEDCDNDGVRSPGEAGIPGVTVTLVGTNITGSAVNLPTLTGPDGGYQFANLYPGTYTVVETPPAGYLPGKVTPGTVDGLPVGSVSGRSFTGVVLGKGSNGVAYNFGELKPSSLSGLVYFDIFHNGVLDPNDFGIAHVRVNLSGTDDLGQTVALTSVTDEDGSYAFTGLRPGNYAIVRVQPSAFHRYRNTVGTAGGAASANAFRNIPLAACTDGVDYNFGALQRPDCRLRSLAVHVGNTFYHFQRTYERDPEGFARTYPRLVDSVAAGQVPWGKSPFPTASRATYWVPKLGTRPVVPPFPVHGIKYRPLLPAAPALARAARAR